AKKKKKKKKKKIVFLKKKKKKKIAKDQSTLPQVALYLLRFHSFYPWHNKHGYMHLCDEKDLEYLKWVKKFQKCDLYSKSRECPTLTEVADYYKPIVEKYFPRPVRW
ncbi:myo-inositol oxygenase, partial [Reticulomyxa filosa]